LASTAKGGERKQRYCDALLDYERQGREPGRAGNIDVRRKKRICHAEKRASPSRLRQKKPWPACRPARLDGHKATRRKGVRTIDDTNSACKAAWKRSKMGPGTYEKGMPRFNGGKRGKHLDRSGGLREKSERRENGRRWLLERSEPTGKRESTEILSRRRIRNTRARKWEHNSRIPPPAKPAACRSAH